MELISVHPLNASPFQPCSSAPPRTPTPDEYCVWNVNRCRWSKFEGPRSALRSSQFCAITELTCPLPPSAAFSLDRAYVSCPVAVKPLCSRRRNCNCPLSRVELPFEVIYTYPEGHEGQGLTAPAGYVLGRNACTARVPLMPFSVAVITIAAGRSICAEPCQFCALPMRKSGSMANVFGVTPGVALNPLARVSGFSGPFCTLRLFESGDCCAICMAIVL